MRIQVGVTVAADPARTWVDLEDISSHVQWMADAESIEFVGPRTAGVGTSFVCVTKVGPIRLRDTMTVTEWVPKELMAIDHQGLVRGRGRFSLDPLPGDRTRFTWTETLRFPWWMAGRLGELVAQPVLRRIWQSNLRRFAARFDTDEEGCG